MNENLRRQIAELTAVHKGLTNIVEGDAETILSGKVPFEASADGLETISDSFELELIIPHDFPEKLPQVKETGGRIGADYDHRNSDGTLCLAVPVEQRRVFFEQPTLLGFVNRLVVPYLYGYYYWKTYGRHPFEEAPHGYKGILGHYIDTLGLRGDLDALAVICFLFEHGYRGHHQCPCGSGLRVRACHGPALRAFHEHHTPETLLSDFIAIFEICFQKYQKGELAFPQSLRLQIMRILNRLKG